MSSIVAHARTVRELLDAKKYSIDYYQREYKWTTKQIEELLDDLEDKFFNSYVNSHERTQVQRYTGYFLGSIVISERETIRYIVDGQQRLSSLTLLLLHLHNLQQDSTPKVDVRSFIFSEQYGAKSFNLNIPERARCMEALYNGREFDASEEQDESVRNLAGRYEDIQSLFPESLQGIVLPYFIDWLIEKVTMVEIVAESDEEAYTIFETMNDRGLSLSPTDMLKGYLLANITDQTQRIQAADLWKQRMIHFVTLGKEEESDFFKAWLRAKYADSIRERKKGAVNQDFDKIGTAFHRWVREEKIKIGLNTSLDFDSFVQGKFKVLAQ